MTNSRLLHNYYIHQIIPEMHINKQLPLMLQDTNDSIFDNHTHKGLSPLHQLDLLHLIRILLLEIKNYAFSLHKSA